MKFKIEDKVKVIKCVTDGERCKNLNKVSTITEIREGSCHPYILKNIKETFRDDELELVKRQFTKSDMKDGDIATDREGRKRTVSKGFIVDNFGAISLTYFTEDLKDTDGLKENDIVKVERPAKYETVFKRKEEILDETEKRYLASVIRPWRDIVDYIAKLRSVEQNGIKEYIVIFTVENDKIVFPEFEADTMYKEMEVNKKYSLEELGL